jgi:hypothetical protein
VAELRAYALAAAELRSLAGATGRWGEDLRTLARQASAMDAWAPRARDVLGPIYRRVPGTRVVHDDDLTPADLDALLAGGPVPPSRTAATWRLVEALVAGLAWSSTRVPDVDLPRGLLHPSGLPVPAVDALLVGWCPAGSAAAVPALADWLAGADGWAEDARRAGRPQPDVVLVVQR